MRSVEFCKNSGAKHVSAYILKIEEGTFFHKKRESLILPDDDETSDLYMTAVDALSEAGFRQYEISNFSLDGKESVHNSAYWRRVPYLGFGPGAHSFWGETRRWNKSDMGLYLKGTDYFEQETLTAEDVLVEKVFLGLRCSQGLLYEGLGLDRDKVAKFIADGSLVCTGDRLYLSPEKYFVSDSIIRELI
jgi:oxygen-independent coproporphyrinogen-3 oxidase